MTDRYRSLRAALRAGPTRGPWKAEHKGSVEFSLTGAGDISIIGGCGCCGSPWLDSDNADADAAYLGEADPSTISALMEERDRLAVALRNCYKLAYNCHRDELPGAIITTASKALANRDGEPT